MKCCVCNSNNTGKLFAVAGHRLVKCNLCGMAYTADFSQEETFYSKNNYFTQKNQYVSHWDNFCVTFESLINKISGFKRQGTFLDVGAGVGALLHVAALKGFTVKGLEVSTWAAQYAREEKGFDVFSGTLEEAKFSREQFDVVVINHVLEHVPDPKALLHETCKVLKQDGLLVVGVPNFGGIMARLARGQWASLLPDEHRWHFNSKTLRRLLSDTGFRVVMFESKENHAVLGWGIKSLIRRLINGIAIATNRSEAMLMFAVKDSERPV